MKQSDIAIILIVLFIGGIASFFLSGFLFGGEKNTFTSIVVDPIGVEFSTPDSRYFNSESIDPTRTIQIGDNASQAAGQ